MDQPFGDRLQRGRRTLFGQTFVMAVYQIHFHIEREILVRVGRLGRFRFPAGRYFYTGSARRAAEARIRRHLARRKKRHWHIDYLLGRREAVVDLIVVGEEKIVGSECDLHQRALAALGATTPVPRFGSSDCRGGCPSHLGRLKRNLRAKTILRRIALREEVEGTTVHVPQGRNATPR